jgi:glycosyltransferase involved in cell wall biosynthesis
VSLRILILNHEFPPVGTGASAGTLGIAKGYAQRGHAVTVVTMQYGGLEASDVEDGIQIYRVSARRRRVDRCSAPEMLFYILSAIRFLRSHLQTHTYEVAHAQFVLPAGVIAWWAKRRYSLPYVLTCRGSDVLGHNPRFRMLYPLVARAWSRVIRQAAVVTCATRFLADRIQRLEPGVQVTVVPNAVDPAWFRPLPKENRILIVGRLIPLKGVGDALDALSRLDLNGWHVDIVGDGVARADLQRQTARRRLTSRITFHGWIDHRSTELREMYGRARVFVTASHRENMSVSVLEAIAAGCWIVASDSGGTPEFVDATSLFRQGNISALTEKLASTMAASRARPAAPLDSRFRWEHVIPTYEDLCRLARKETPSTRKG